MMCNRILVVEDQIDIRQAIVEALEYNDYKVAQAENGEDALRYLIGCGRNLPGLILLDLRMPVMSGEIFLETIQSKHKEFHKIPIVIASANTLDSDNISVKFAVQRLIKPIDLDELERTVKKHCGEPVIN